MHRYVGSLSASGPETRKLRLRHLYTKHIHIIQFHWPFQLSVDTVTDDTVFLAVFVHFRLIKPVFAEFRTKYIRDESMNHFFFQFIGLCNLMAVFCHCLAGIADVFLHKRLFELMIKQKNLPRCLVVAKLVLENHNTHAALNFSCQDKCNDNNQHDQKYFYKYWHCF